MLFARRLIYIVAVTLLVTSSCKKKDNNPTPYKATFDPLIGATVLLQPSAAFLVVRYNMLDNTGVDTAIHTYGYAWFGTPIRTEIVKSVTLNGVALYDSGYCYMTLNALSLTQYSFSWVVSGDSSLLGDYSIPSLSYTDTASYPAMALVALPDSISALKPLTIPLKALNVFTQYVYCLQSPNNYYGLYLGVSPARADSLTISPSAIQSVVSSGDTLEVTIVAVMVTSPIIDDKQFYFVVQSSYTAQTVIQ